MNLPLNIIIVSFVFPESQSSIRNKSHHSLVNFGISLNNKMTENLTQDSRLAPRQQLQVRRRLDGPVKLVCSSLLFIGVVFSAGIVSVLTAPRYTPRTCDKSRTIFDGRSGLISDDSHPYTNGNYTQVI